jgi:hypothetical protein
LEEQQLVEGSTSVGTEPETVVGADDSIAADVTTAQGRGISRSSATAGVGPIGRRRRGGGGARSAAGGTKKKEDRKAYPIPEVVQVGDLAGLPLQNGGAWGCGCLRAVERRLWFVCQVVRTHTVVDVQWQDGSITEGMQARHLFPLSHFGEPNPYVPAFIMLLRYACGISQKWRGRPQIL